MNWKKLLLIVGLIVILIIVIFFIIFSTSAYSNGFNMGIIEMNLSGCEKIPSFKYMVKSTSNIFGGNSYYIKNQRQSCIDDVSTNFGFYGDNLQTFFTAVKNNNPDLCPPSGTFECLDKIKEKYKEPSVCSHYTSSEFDKEYQQYTFIFECQGYLIAFEKQDIDYCKQFEGDVKNYCYIIIAREYNDLRRIKSNPLVIHQTYDGVSYFKPKPKIPYICNEINDSALKESCEYVFAEFNSLETPTLNS